MQRHDVVVIGAGPAGLSAAAELSPRGDCLLLEHGRGHHDRDRDTARDILEGIGGAGLFSDGKHSFYPSASALWTLPDPDLVATAFTRTADLLARHGVAATPFQTHTAPSPTPGAWHVKHYPAIYMPLAQRMAAISELADACPQRWTDTRLVSATRDEHGIRLGVHRGDTHLELHTTSLIVATGRLSPRWIHPWLTDLGASYKFRRLEFGVRIESRADAPLFHRLAGVDPKLRFLEPDSPSETRTFCLCRDGEVVTGESHRITALSGRADGPPTGRSNLGLLVRTSDASLAHAVAPVLFAATPRSMPLAAVDLAALRPLFGDLGAAAVLRALERLTQWCPALSNDRDAVLHAPCIEGVGDYPVDDGRLQVAANTWLAGDVCGRFRGIVASMVSGRYAAAQLMRATR